MFDEITGMVLVNNDNSTFLLCDDVKRGKLSFDDDNFRSCIGVNNMRGEIELLRICAKELSDNENDYLVISKFIDKVEEIATNSFEKSDAICNIEVINDE